MLTGKALFNTLLAELNEMGLPGMSSTLDEMYRSPNFLELDPLMAINSLPIVSGIICDGAKPSCAAKIASSVQAGIMGYHMYQNGQQFRGGDGIVTKGVENTIRNVSQLGREGMRETDKEIVKIMLQES